eukprot:EG_transcript_3591
MARPMLAGLALLGLGGLAVGFPDDPNPDGAANCTCPHPPHPPEGPESIFSMGTSITKHARLLNAMFLIVIGVTVVLEFGMYLLTRAATKHFELLVAHLNKELALLGLVAFLLMTVNSTGMVEYFSLEVVVFEWCHIILFFMAVLNILSHTILNLTLKWQEHHYRHFERQNREILVAGIQGATSSLHLDFELARFVFESDRKHFFSKQWSDERTRDRRRFARESSLQGSARDRDEALAMLQEVAATAAMSPTTPQGALEEAAAVGNPLSVHSGSLSPRYLPPDDVVLRPDVSFPGVDLEAGPTFTRQETGMSPDRKATGSLRICSGASSIHSSKEVRFSEVIATSSPPAAIESPSSPLNESCTPAELLLHTDTLPSDLSLPQLAPQARPMQAESDSVRSDDLLRQLRRLRSFATLKARLEKVSEDARAIHKPDEFSFAEYLIRCARQELVNMLHVGVLAWCFMCVLLAIHQAPLSYLHGHASALRGYALAPGIILFSAFFIIWFHLIFSYWRCMRRLTKVAVLHSRKLDPEETALQRTLMATLAQRHPKLFSRMATGNRQESENDSSLLRSRREQLYLSSIRKNRHSFRTPFTYPQSLNLMLQVLLLFLAFYTATFLMTFGPRLLLPDRPTEEGFYWIVGVGLPVLVYLCIMPDILFRHTFVISVGDRIDLRIMRAIENEQREKLAQYQRALQRRRIVARMRRKMQLLALFGVDTWDQLVAALEALPAGRSPRTGDTAPASRSPSAL